MPSPTLSYFGFTTTAHSLKIVFSSAVCCKTSRTPEATDQPIPAISKVFHSLANTTVKTPFREPQKAKVTEQKNEGWIFFKHSARIKWRVFTKRRPNTKTSAKHTLLRRLIDFHNCFTRSSMQHTFIDFLNLWHFCFLLITSLDGHAHTNAITGRFPLYHLLWFKSALSVIILFLFCPQMLTWWQWSFP